jgi:hypothetical protein
MLWNCEQPTGSHDPCVHNGSPSQEFAEKSFEWDFANANWCFDGIDVLVS